MFLRAMVLLSLVGVSIAVKCHLYMGSKTYFEPGKEVCEGEGVCVHIDSPTSKIASCSPDCDIEKNYVWLMQSAAEKKGDKKEDIKHNCCKEDFCNGATGGISLSSLLPLTLSLLSFVFYSMQ